MLDPIWGVMAMAAYVAMLFGISWSQARHATLSDYLIGGRSSAWWMLTIGMISDSISGVTYVSVPGAVHAQSYSYLQIIFGHFFGYQIIASVLLPLYYQRNSISIYQYLRDRFGHRTEKTGTLLFIASRLFGSAARLYIATLVLHTCFFPSTSPVPSFVFAILLIVIYTLKGGIKSLVWTDAFQSIFLVVGMLILFFTLARELPDPVATLKSGQIFFWDPLAKNYFFKHFLGGMLITVAMNGLDQNIMQKNLSAPTLRDAQKNMILFGFVLVAVNAVIILLGQLLITAYQVKGLPLPLTASGIIATDRLLPELVFQHLGTLPSVFLVLGLSAATLSSADSVLPTIASSVQIDLLSDRQRERIPIRLIHIAAAIAILGLILMIHWVGTRSLIDLVLKYSGFIYGPLLGIYAIGIFSKVTLSDRRLPICVLGAIALTVLFDQNAQDWLHGYQPGFEIILVNACFLVILALSFAREKGPSSLKFESAS